MSQAKHTTAEGELYQRIGKQVKVAREKKRMTREQLAAKIRSSSTTISTIERGVNRISLGRFLDVCRVLKLDWGALLGDSVSSSGVDLDVVEDRIHHEIAKLMLDDNTLSATVALQRAAKAASDAIEAVKADTNE